MNNPAIKVLLAERAKLLAETQLVQERLQREIFQIEAAIEVLSGKKVWLTESETRYDDEHPDYVKASQEEI